MFCIFTSECQKKARKRTAALLDRYGRRIGRRTWIAELTSEAADDIYKHLRRSASKNTSVACFKNKGYETMSLQWIVGNKNAYDTVYGAFSCGTKVRYREPPLWLKVGMMLCAAAGRLHDIGKDTLHFQNKLQQAKIIADYVRHEWLSAHVLKAALDERSSALANGSVPLRDAMVQHIQAQRDFTQKAIEEFPFHGITCAHEALTFLVTTHHRIFGPITTKPEKSVDSSNHVRAELWNDCPGIFSRPRKDALAKKNILSATRALERLEVAKKDLPSVEAAHFWRGMAIISRAALLLADHHVSARQYQGPSSSKRPIANSREQQPLDWHLEQVGLQAARYMRCFEGRDLPGLCPGVIERILTPSPPGSRYVWQDTLANALRQVSGPAIVFNVAGTGAGKTRANLKCICALQKDGPVRAVAAFNLRTLTLQTYDEYTRQFGMSREDAALLIGDATTRILHRAVHSAPSAASGGDDMEEFVPDVSGAETLPIPDWLQDLEHNAKMPLGALIAAPCLVSTMDFIDDAGNLHRTGRHPLALLRVATSDIIIDEADSFDVKSYPAILRLVELAGLFGRNVVMSSATLSEKLAAAAYRAWMRGCRMGTTIFGTRSPVVVFGSNFVDPLLLPREHIDSRSFATAYGSYMEFQVSANSRHKKIAKILPIKSDADSSDDSVFFAQIAAYAGDFHKDNSTSFSGKSVSFGLIRVANIQPAMKLSEYLARNGVHDLPGIGPTELLVCPYHARDLSGRRFYKEYYLDQILKCTPSGDRPGFDHVKDRIITSSAKNIVFLVVATPVEEVGRDHDFDWAIIEPSSMHSIIQIAGRVNRHRLSDMTNPNIGILQFNLKGWREKKPHFLCPGLQISIPCRGRDVKSHPTHDLRELMKTAGSKISPGETFPLTVGLCFGKDRTVFADADDKAIEHVIGVAEELRDQPLGWAAGPWLIGYPLRDEQGTESYYYDPESQSIFQFSDEERCEKQTGVVEKRLSDAGQEVENRLWLCPNVQEVLTFIESLGITDMPPQKALGFTLYARGNDKEKPPSIEIAWNGVARIG